jgi:hypothetical protein
MFAATDIRRLRVVSAIGQLRVEIEALALMYLFRSESKLAVEWYHIRTDQEGRKFYNKTKKHVLHFCQTHDLETEWNIASAAAQHARLGGLIDGLRFTQSIEAGRHVDQYSLALQDFDPNQPEAFIARGLYLLRTQAKLLLPMKKALSEVTDLLLLETRIPRYLQAIRRLYLTFERAYPEYVAQYGNQ